MGALPVGFALHVGRARAGVVVVVVGVLAFGHGMDPRFLAD
jgi:hypothetical protein